MGKCCSKLPNHATSTPHEQICRIDGARIDSSSAPFQMDRHYCTPGGHFTVPSAQVLDMDGRHAKGRQTNIELGLLLTQKPSRRVRFRGYNESPFMDDSPTSAMVSSLSSGLDTKMLFRRTRSCGNCMEEERAAAAAAGLARRQRITRRRRSYNGAEACTEGHDDIVTDSRLAIGGGTTTTSTVNLISQQQRGNHLKPGDRNSDNKKSNAMLVVEVEEEEACVGDHAAQVKKNLQEEMENAEDSGHHHHVIIGMRGVERQLFQYPPPDHYNKCDETHRGCSSINIDEETYSSAPLMLSSDSSASSSCSKISMMMMQRPSFFHQDGLHPDGSGSGGHDGDPSQLGGRHTESSAAHHEEKEAEVEEEEEEEDHHYQRLQPPVLVGGGDHIFLQLLLDEEEEEKVVEKQEEEEETGAEEEHLFSLLLGKDTESSSPALLAAATIVDADFSSVPPATSSSSSSSLLPSSRSSSPFRRVVAPSSKIAMPSSSSPADSIPLRNDGIHRASPFFLASYLYPALAPPSQSSAPSSHQSSGCNTPLKEFEFMVKCCNSEASTPMFSSIKSRGNAEAAVMEQLTAAADALTIEEIAEIWRVFEQRHACS